MPLKHRHASLELILTSCFLLLWQLLPVGVHGSVEFVHVYSSDQSKNMVISCNSPEECGKFFNETEPIHGVMMSENGEDVGRPCLIEGHLDIAKNWFGYLVTTTMKAKSGRFYYRFVYPEHKCCVKIILYLEEQVSSLRARMNCLQKQSIVDPTSPQVITLTPSVDTSGCTSNRSDENGIRLIECNSGRILRSDVDRNWYIGASSCGSPSGLDLHYSIILYGYKGMCPVSPTSNSIGRLTPSELSALPSLLIIAITTIFFTRDFVHSRDFAHEISPQYRRNR